MLVEGFPFLMLLGSMSSIDLTMLAHAKYQQSSIFIRLLVICTLPYFEKAAPLSLNPGQAGENSKCDLCAMLITMPYRMHY